MISPYVRRLRLAAEMRALRAEGGLTHEQLAKKIGSNRAQISRLENGHVIDQADVMSILDALGVEGERWTTILTIAREAGERGWWESNRKMGQRQALYANLEAGAATIREYQGTFVPGLLQTPEYTRARIEADRQAGAAGYTTDKAIDGRLGRQRMLRRPDGPTYEVVLDEVAIRRRTAPAEILKAQVYHLTAMVNVDPRVSLRVLPVDAEIEGYSVPRSAFSIYTFADPGDPNVVAADTVTDDLVLTEDDAVRRYAELFNRLRQASLSKEDSLRFLIEIAQDMRS
jgi:transcriptional regulator with XRE-family HTH domain